MTVELSQNGWAVIPAYGDPRLETLPQVMGSKNVLGGPVHDLFARLATLYQERVEPIAREDSWGYSPRPITGNSKVWSNHASGTAVDFNASKYPMYRAHMSEAKIARCRALVAHFEGLLRWGGDYPRQSIDQMHWEIAKGVTSARIKQFLRKELGMPPGMVSPVSGRVTSEFSRSRKNPATGRVEPHLGIDIAAPKGTPIHAVFAGTVIGVGSGLLPGRSGDRNIRIRNPDGETQYYGHCEAYYVRVGQKVDIDQVIGEVGARGNATGPHVHLETHDKHGTAVDPRVYFKHHGVTPGVRPQPVPPPTPVPTPQEDIMASIEDLSKLLEPIRDDLAGIKRREALAAGLQQGFVKFEPDGVYYATEWDGSVTPVSSKTWGQFRLTERGGPVEVVLVDKSHYEGRINGTYI